MSKYDFKAWLETKNPNEGYSFADCCGDCLMGQYMASKGERWDMSKYNEYVHTILGQENVSVLSGLPQTFGDALNRVNKVLEDA